jgi:hypothetical protein
MGKLEIECAACRKKFEEGEEVLDLQEAIVGINDIVPLNGRRLFCSEDCLKDCFFKTKSNIKLKRRVP